MEVIFCPCISVVSLLKCRNWVHLDLTQKQPKYFCFCIFMYWDSLYKIPFEEKKTPWIKKKSNENYRNYTLDQEFQLQLEYQQYQLLAILDFPALIFCNSIHSRYTPIYTYFTDIISKWSLIWIFKPLSQPLYIVNPMLVSLHPSHSSLHQNLSKSNLRVQLLSKVFTDSKSL